MASEFRNHRFIVYYEPWTREWYAYSDTIGPEDSPSGAGLTPSEAIIDLLEHMETANERRLQEGKAPL